MQIVVIISIQMVNVHVWIIFKFLSHVQNYMDIQQTNDDITKHLLYLEINLKLLSFFRPLLMKL